jgi:RNA polymerase sigma-70 factor (ECF subfamily)
VSGEKEFNAIVKQFSKSIYNHAFYMLGNHEAAEDATYDAFLKIHRGLESFRGESELSTWIWRITTNVCLTVRAKKRLPTISIEDELDAECALAVSDNTSPHDVVARKETRQQLDQLIARLPDKEGTALTLYYFEEMNYKEIADVMKIPAGSVATALHRGRERLRLLLLQLEDQP